MTTKVVTGEVRSSYVNIFEGRPNDWGSTTYSMMAFIPKTDKATLAKITNAIKTEAKEKYGDDIDIKDIKIPLRDGDKMADLPVADDPAKQVKVGDAPYAGNYFMNLSTYDQPKVVDTQLNDILDKNQFVSGDYCRVSMNIAPLGAKAKKRGIGAYLNQVQFVRKGEPLGKPATRPEDDFAVIESASGSDEASIEDMLA